MHHINDDRSFIIPIRKPCGILRDAACRADQEHNEDQLAADAARGGAVQVEQLAAGRGIWRAQGMTTSLGLNARFHCKRHSSAKGMVRADPSAKTRLIALPWRAMQNRPMNCPA